MKGRKPEPTALRLLKGNPQRRPINSEEPKPKPARPRCPSWLNPVAKREWNRVARELEALGLLAKLDRTALAAWCQIYARWREAEEILAEEDLLLKTAKGYVYQNPALTVATKSLEQLRQWLTEFGLSPSARARLKVPKPEKKNPLSQIAGRGSRRSG